MRLRRPFDRFVNWTATALWVFITFQIAISGEVSIWFATAMAAALAWESFVNAMRWGGRR